MRRSGNNVNLPKWEQIETFLGSKLPALPSAQQIDMLKDTSWIEDYVQQVLTQSIPKMGLKNNRNQSSPEVFDTHNYVIVKIKISDRLNPTVKVRTDQVRIEDTEHGEKKIVRLPCLVIPRSSRSSYKDGILQIKMRKKKIDKTYHEVPIKYL